MKFGTLFLITLMLLTSCVTQRISTIVGCDYDEKKNQTDYFVIPYGSVSIPGEWSRTIYNQISKQQFFKNSDSIIVAIAFGPCNRYEFNATDSKKGFEFVEAFYEWEAEFYVNNYHLHQEKIESNEKDNYIIWRVFGENNDRYWDTYFLFGERNGFASNFSIMKTNKWTEEEKVTFLKNLYVVQKTQKQ